MEQTGRPSTEQMAQVLDNAPVAILVSTLESRELLYCNRLAKESLQLDGDGGKLTCYRAAGFQEPCPFCHAGQMSSCELLERIYHHPLNGRAYQLSGKLIDWAGQPAHIEYILDVTDRQREEERSSALREELLRTFSSVPCGLCVYLADGKKISPVFHNPAFYEIMGYSEEHVSQVERETSYLGVHEQDLGLLKEKVKRALECGGVMQHTYRLWNDRAGEYRWIRLDGSVKSQPQGGKLLYCVYTDVSEQKRLEQELGATSEKMQEIINTIPGGIAIYKVSDIFETAYFSDGVPELTGYSVEEYRELIRRDAAEMIYWEDVPAVLERAGEIIRTHQGARLEFRKQHRNGQLVWVRVQAKWIGEEDGCPLLYCVFHNITDLKNAQLEMDHLLGSIPGGIASYRVEGSRFVPTYYSDGVMALSGHTREEFGGLVGDDALNTVYEADQKRVRAAAKAALESGGVLDISYRMRHKDGSLIWIHLNGRRMGPLSENPRFYAVFTSMSSAESRLFKSIANETADGIYVIDKENYDLLYSNESKRLFGREETQVGKKCYAALHGKTAPCEFCTLKSHAPDGKEHEMALGVEGRYFSTRFREIDWNGIPAYVKYVQDVTEDVQAQKERERLEQYFQTVVKHLAGGIAVIRYERDGRPVPEFLSDGFAALTGMTLPEAWDLYRQDAMAGVHPDDRESVNGQMAAYIAGGESRCEIIYRLKKGDGSYVWVKNTLSIIQSEGGESRVYAVYHDMTRELEEKEQLRQQYNDLILQHYRMPGPNALVVGHCNITRNQILEIIDHTHSGLLRTFGTVREEFFTGLSDLLPDPGERREFLETYLNAPSLEAYQKGDTELIRDCFIQLPYEKLGRYARFKVNLVETPDTGDVTGILTVTDITEQTISDRILHQLSVASYDLVADVDLRRDCYTILTGDTTRGDVPARQGCHSEHIEYMLQHQVLPKDKQHVQEMLDPQYVIGRLGSRGSYSFAYSIQEKGDILTKNLTVSATDLRLGRICLARTDITDSVREQQGLLNVIAYTFELLGFINLDQGRMTMYTRQTVLENLPPFEVEDYGSSVERIVGYYTGGEGREEIGEQFQLKTMIRRLEEKPSGYDVAFPYHGEEGLRYKQVNVLWGDRDHKTVCMVRADVTDMLAAERRSKQALQKALALAEEANRAKSDFLSSMSHDIRTPMNAIMGMTSLAIAHIGEQGRVEDCLRKISYSSRHLLSLINDILDMNKIERSKITLNHMHVSLPELAEQLCAMLSSQALSAGLRFGVSIPELRHPYFYGDPLRINQILINIIGNAVKFTPEGGEVYFAVEELPPERGERNVRYRFTVRDTGIGMSEEFLEHIFEPFTRNGNTQRVEGTGLGLSITKGLVDLMGGRISVESELHKGTTFFVELECEAAAQAPCAAPQIEMGAENMRRERALDGRRFLVAEDNAINSEILCELLQMYGGQCVVKTDGMQAVRAFAEAGPGTYDAVLMDIQMPVMNGYEATRAIRALERPDAKTIPIIAMTANAFTEDIQAALEAGMNEHVAKPIDLKVLWETLNRLLGK
ncbi:MAG: PAS domain S-box protein [Clostridiales bacterium]|uniref:hybrid sensor histidine kinase/response regulator n=1 Tax=Provencibacterium massiliense TaxID=1841868 RepID=UPI0009A85DF3|nr:hybrid sensor histidine kinase/response regulator [Provencibacterium massiliense]PWM36211.1 MAG: PAS domain S-box protein [Clostridiales bacterium]RGB69633.1 PAS domain S-box protein [Harryflintia acetispora]